VRQRVDELEPFIFAAGHRGNERLQLMDERIVRAFLRQLFGDLSRNFLFEIGAKY
jgi:hypothetical protein